MVNFPNHVAFLAGDDTGLIGARLALACRTVPMAIDAVLRAPESEQFLHACVPASKRLAAGHDGLLNSGLLPYPHQLLGHPSVRAKKAAYGELAIAHTDLLTGQQQV